MWAMRTFPPFELPASLFDAEFESGLSSFKAGEVLMGVWDTPITA
jgi:hypothetical protein